MHDPDLYSFGVLLLKEEAVKKLEWVVCLWEYDFGGSRLTFHSNTIED